LFRGDSTNAEYVYLRQHKSGRSDAMQYTPVLNTGLNWQLYSGPGFTGAVDIPRNEWFHLRLEFAGAQGKLFVKDMNAPALVMTRPQVWRPARKRLAPRFLPARPASPTCGCSRCPTRHGPGISRR
jgi:hypothetical protein